MRYSNAEWRDLLTAYGDELIIYEGQTLNGSTVSGTPVSGNPISYYNGTRWTFDWDNGRELTTASKTGTSVNYTYDADGMRKTKTVNGVPHTYYYNGGTLLREVYGDTILDFFYNANGTPIAMRQSAVGSTNYTIYYYITNLQGDVIRLVNHRGETAAYYRYDPYGKVIEASGSHANINPLRYRGYYYDVDTGLYYLQSRYYDPQICRFINADSLVTTGNGMVNTNMFAYCLNNPVNGCDPCGTCFHRLDFWNDCEKCGGKTLGEKLNDFATGIYDYGADVYDAHMMQIESQQEVDQNSFRAMRDSTAAMWDAYEHSIELEAQTQYNRDMATIKTYEFIQQEPLLAVDVAVTTVGVGATYLLALAGCHVIAIPTAVGVGLTIAADGSTIWGAYRTYSGAWAEWQEYINGG